MTRILIFTVCFFCLISTATACWTEQNYLGIIGDAQRVMPENFQWVITRYAAAFYEGHEQNRSRHMTQESSIESIISDSESAIQAFTSSMSYSEGSKLLGRIARQISDLHALLTQPERLNDQSWSTDYAIYLQQNRQYFRILWKGQDNHPRNRDDLMKLLHSTASKNSKLSGILESTLNRENKSISEYDVRSTPFGAGTITYSSAVNTLAQTWLYIWDRSGGIR